MKLHLGCGQRYLGGYVNIDFPPTEHTVQVGSVADRHADLLELTYPEGSVEEIRLHHVFEHFARHTACALVASWQSWLKVGGLLRIEVPDLLLTGLAALNPFAAVRSRCVAERHLFGSHEAGWASHKEAYSAGQLGGLLKTFGFAIDRVNRNRWRGTYNFEVLAHKKRSIGRAECERAARVYLSAFLIDDSPTEQRLIDVWMDGFRHQVSKSWADAEVRPSGRE